MEHSLYIHIPFCKRKCTYCDFYSVVGDDLAGAYVDALCTQMRALASGFTTVYVGGGTPTALPKQALAMLVAEIAKRTAPECEFTVEANPESFDAERARILRDGGVNRLSIGTQSFDEKKLKRLGRIHTAARAKEAVELAAAAGFKNVSIDLIFGVWGEDVKTWEQDLEAAARLPVKHISAYSLTYEKGTPLFDALQAKSVVPLDEDAVGGMYETAIDRLALRGFKQYEISNFAIQGYECRHNLNYWENNAYIGLGASAVSYLDGVHTTNVADVKEYISRVDARRDTIAAKEKLSPVRRAKETVAVKIRTKAGIDFSAFRARTGYDFLTLERRPIDKLLDAGLVKYLKTRGSDAPTGIALTRRGFLLCDTVSSELV